jgi:hypothetical protein
MAFWRPRTDAGMRGVLSYPPRVIVDSSLGIPLSLCTLEASLGLFVQSGSISRGSAGNPAAGSLVQPVEPYQSLNGQLHVIRNLRLILRA